MSDVERAIQSESSAPGGEYARTAPPVSTVGTKRPLRIVLAPMNFANMPIQLLHALRKRGYEAEHVQYTMGNGHRFGYKLDNEVDVTRFVNRADAHVRTLSHYLERDFDIFHFWNKSFYFSIDYTGFTGFDIPLIKARGKRVIHRFSGFDLRLPTWDLAVNPHSPFRYGYEFPADEKAQIAFIDFLREYADRLLVQDPELGQFIPEARVIPRALDLSEWPFVGVTKTDRPLVVHAPSKDVVKGTAFVLKAVDQLRSEGLSFDFKLIKNVSHAQAREWIQKSDIVVDQLLIGATGVVTLEAWALGKPVVLNLREDLFAPFYKTKNLPVANANPDTITDVLRKLVKDYEWRSSLSQSGRALVEAYHDIDAVIEQYVDLYNEVVTTEPVRPSGFRDVEYFRVQACQTMNLQQSLQDLERLLGNLSLLPPGWKDLAKLTAEERAAQIGLLTTNIRNKALVPNWGVFLRAGRERLKNVARPSVHALRKLKARMK